MQTVPSFCFSPDAVDDYVGPDNPVRFIDAFVDSLDLKEAGLQRVRPNDKGRPGYDPADLLKLYIYGYLNRVRSSRRLEAETHRNLEMIWLLRQLRPDFKTIADFRRDNRSAFRQVFRGFVRLCRELDLYGRELIAVDGTRSLVQYRHGTYTIRRGGAVGVARGPLRGAMPLNPGDGGRRQRPVPPERLLYWPRAGEGERVPLTSSVTGVNHPTRCDRLLYPASTSPPASDEACRASTPTVILRNAFDLGGGAVSGLLAGYRADRVRVEVEYLTRSQGPATAAVGATTNVVLQGKDTEWSDDQPPREWIRDYAAHQIFANLYYDFPNESPWTPYVGGGLGVAITTLHYANQFIRKPDAEYLRIDFEPDWPAAAKRAAADTLSSLDTTVRQEAFGFQVLAGADYALTEHTSVGVTGRWAQFGHITDEATWDLIRSHAPVQADGVTPFDTTQRFEGISYLAVTVGLKYYF